jgi:hypothetical protein
MAIGCPSSLEALSAIARIDISVEPPAGHGTISVIGLVGYSCALAVAEISMPTAATAIVKRRALDISNTPLRPLFMARRAYLLFLGLIFPEIA